MHTPRIVIIADDLTGANATGVLLAKEGFKTFTVLNLNNYRGEENKDLNVISISTDSRGIHKKEAYNRVSNIVKSFKDKDTLLISKRIDSTLRGNIGAEVDAVLDNLGEESMAIIVPAFPSSGRITVGGYLLVNSLPLEKTEAAKDAKTPVNTSCIDYLIRSQSKYNVNTISLDTVLKGPEKIKERILIEKQQGTRVIIIDAVTEENILDIAKGVKLSNINVVPVDPGPFTSMIAKELFKEFEDKKKSKVMLTIGSVSDLTRKQIKKLKSTYSTLIINIQASRFLNDDSFNEEVKKVVNTILKNIDNYSIIGISTAAISENEVLDLQEIAKYMNTTEEDISKRICNGLASITKEILEKKNDEIDGLFISGGDVTLAVCNKLNIEEIQVKEEIIPLAVYGKITKGQYKNKSIITKGGLIGDETAIIKCINYLLDKSLNN